MFKISPINDFEIQKSAAQECGRTALPSYFSYSMRNTEDSTLMAFSQFEIDGENGFISDIAPRIGYDDFEAMFILGRATMNFIDLCGAHYCYAARNAGDERLLRAIGFRDNGGEFLECDMTGMFDGHCDGHEVKLN